MKYKKPDDIREIPYFSVPMDRKTAKKVLESGLLDAETQKWLEQEMKPFIVYKIKCSGCGFIFDHQRKTKLTEVEVNEGGLCESCIDDWK